MRLVRVVMPHFPQSITYSISRSLSDWAMSRERSRFESLKLAVEAGDETRVRELLQRKFSRKFYRKSPLNCQTGGDILWDAVLNDRIEIASMLVEAGANLDVRRDFQFGHQSTFIHKLVKSNDERHHRLAVLMLKHGAKLNDYDGYILHGSTPLGRAIQAECPIDVIRELVKHGARVTASPIVEAAHHSNAAEVMALLVGELVDEETRKHRVDDALLRCSMGMGINDYTMPAVKLLLDMKLAVEDFKMARYTLLNAIQVDNVEMVELLIQYGFDVNKPAANGELPLCAASKLQRSTITEMLIRAGAKVNNSSYVEPRKYGEAGYEGYAIHAACESESLANIRVLLYYGADIRVTDDRDRTPFSMIKIGVRVSAAHQVVIKHLAVLNFKGKSVNDSDSNAIERHCEMRAYYEQCLKEMEKTKRMKMMNNASFFSIFENLGKIAFLTRYLNFIEIYNSAEQKDEFPIYCEEIDFLVEKAKVLSNLLSEKEEAICGSLKNIVPYLPLERIIYYFYLNEIE